MPKIRKAIPGVDPKLLIKDAAKLLPVTVAVVAVLGFIFLSSLFLDITHPVANPF